MSKVSRHGPRFTVAAMSLALLVIAAACSRIDEQATMVDAPATPPSSSVEDVGPIQPEAEPVDVDAQVATTPPTDPVEDTQLASSSSSPPRKTVSYQLDEDEDAPAGATTATTATTKPDSPCTAKAIFADMGESIDPATGLTCAEPYAALLYEDGADFVGLEDGIWRSLVVCSYPDDTCPSGDVRAPIVERFPELFETPQVTGPACPIDAAGAGATTDFAGSTSRFDIIICQDPAGGRWYRGTNRNDGSGLTLDGVVITDAGIRATNNGYAYLLDADGLTVFDPGDAVLYEGGWTTISEDWIYLPNRAPRPTVERQLARRIDGSGEFTVVAGVDIEPGTYRGELGNGCAVDVYNRSGVYIDGAASPRRAIEFIIPMGATVHISYCTPLVWISN